MQGGRMLFLSAILFVVLISVASELQDIRKLSLANNEFAFKLYRSFGSDKNTFISPTSIFTALGMLYLGARTTTAEGIRNTLSYEKSGLDDRKIRETYQQLLDLIQNAPDDYQLEVANAMVIHAEFRISPEYKRDLQTYYKAIVKEVDFIKDNLKAVQEINSWVSEKTRGKITKLIENLDYSTRLVLLNAVYFKGKWQTQFNSRFTTQNDFYNHGISAKTTSMMHVKSRFLYGSFPENGFNVIELPYKGDDISMVIVLPSNYQGLSSVERNLEYSQLQRVLSSLRNTTVIVTIPKFKLEYSAELKQVLSNLGMRESFSTRSDLSGISNNETLLVSKVIHKSYIEVNEEGSEAAAVTGVFTNTYAALIPPPTPEFTANHPFFFLIRDRRTEMILFMGRVTKL